MAEQAALYWTKEAGDLARLIGTADAMTEEEIHTLGNKAKKRVADAYSWEFITGEYERLFCEAGH